MRPADARRVLALTAPGPQAPTFKNAGKARRDAGPLKTKMIQPQAGQYNARGVVTGGRDASLAAR
jgi:hypothetical protein